MNRETKLEFCRQLNTAGYDAGIARADGLIVLFYNKRIWRVAGGNPQHPSLIGAKDLTVADVDWLVEKDRTK